MTATIQQRPDASDLDRSLSPRVTVTQYSRRAILGIWAAAALPMGALAWIVEQRRSNAELRAGKEIEYGGGE